MNFYYRLRSKQAKRPTTIYAIISNEGKQWKIATDCKILPTQWDGTKAIISTYNNEQTNQANLLINVKLNDLYLLFQKKVCSFATQQTSFDDVINELKINTMAKKKENTLTTASAILLQGFNCLYLKDNGKIKDNVKESTYNQYKCVMDGIMKYLRENPQHNKINKVGQEFVDIYYNYLNEIGLGKGRQKFIVNLLKNIINNALCVEIKFKKYNIKPILKNYKIVDKRTQEEKKACALTHEQVDAIRKVKLDEKENTARNIFMVEVISGQRVSDNEKVVNMDIANKANTIITKKEGTKAIIIKTEELNYYIKELQKDSNYKAVVGDTTACNKLIKRIAKKANLTMPYNYKNPQGEKVNTTLDKAISTHWGRHTFITLKLREGYSVDDVAKMSGHRDKRMVEEIYNHLTDEDNEKTLLKIIEEKQKEKTKEISIVETKPNNEKDYNHFADEENEKVLSKMAEEYKKILSMFGVDSLEWFEETDVDELGRIVHRYETTFADRLGWNYKQIKELFNDSTKTPKEKREILQKALNN